MEAVSEILGNQNIALERLESRIESTEELHEEGEIGDNKRQYFIDIALNLKENFHRYGDALYHGTWGPAAKNIAETGEIAPGKSRSTGELASSSNVYLTSNASWAFHYSLDNSAPTLSAVRRMASRAFDIDAQNLSRNKLSEFISNLGCKYDSEKKNVTADRLQKIVRDTERLERIARCEGNIPVDEMVIGFGREVLPDEKRLPTVQDEVNTYLDGDKENVIGQVKVDRVSLEDATLYIPRPFHDGYSEIIDEEVEILRYEGLMLLHELRMEEVYRDKGRLDIEGYWAGNYLGIQPELSEWDKNPYNIDPSR